MTAVADGGGSATGTARSGTASGRGVFATVPQAPARQAARAAAERASRGGARTAVTPLHVVQRTVPVGPAFSGEASWYGGSFQGRPTASGEPFDTEQLTAASKTLPFGTRLQVCRTGRCVVVRINDRGPYVGSRVLDLSHAAARVLGYDGVAHITAVPVMTRTVTVPAAPAQPAVLPASAAAGPVTAAGILPAGTSMPPAAQVASPPERVLRAGHSQATPTSTPALLLVGGIAVLGGVAGGRALSTGRRRRNARS